MDARCTHCILLDNKVCKLTLDWNAASGDFAYFAYFSYFFQNYKEEAARASSKQPSCFFQRAECRLLHIPTYTTARIRLEKVCKVCKCAHTLMK